jgi:hypothetical protein
MKRFDEVVEKVSGNKGIITEVINRGEPDECYTVKFFSQQNGFHWERARKNELKKVINKKIGFK